MESIDFKKILFETAFCVMACDGQIDQSEVEEMEKIDKNTSYFNDIDLSQELSFLVNEIKTKGKSIITDFFEKIKTADFSIVQELLIMEISLRLISADNKVEENEITFLNLLRSKLKVTNEILFDRFGKVPYFKDLNRNKIDETTNDNLIDLIQDIKFPNITALEAVEIKKEN